MGGEALALQLHGVQAEMHEHGDLVVGEDDERVRPQLHHLAGHRGDCVHQIARRINGKPISDDALGEGGVRHVLECDRPAGDRRHDGDRRCARLGCHDRRRRYLFDRGDRLDRICGIGGQSVLDVGLQGVRLGAEDRLDVVAHLDHAGGTEGLQPSLVDLALVGDLHA